MRVFLFTFLAIVLFCGTTNGFFGGRQTSSCPKKPCKLDVATKRAVFYELKDKTHLLRTNRVADGAKVKFVCGDKTIKSIKTFCKKGVIQIPAPDTCKANQSLSAVLRPVVSIRRMELCPKSNIDYTVGYQRKSKVFDLYRVCYNRTSLTPIFTKHRIYGGKREAGQQPEVKLMLKEMFKDLNQKFPSVKKDDLKKSVSEFLNKTGIKSKTDVKFVALVPPADFAFDWQRKDAYKFPNVILQFRSVYNGNWRKVEEWVREKASKIDFKKHLTVYTGTYGTLKVNKTEIYLHSKNQIPVPEYTFKIVAVKGKCKVFVTHNNIFEKLKDPICGGKCPAGLKFDQTKEAGESSCCSVEDFKKKFFPKLNERLCKN